MKELTQYITTFKPPILKLIIAFSVTLITLGASADGLGNWRLEPDPVTTTGQPLWTITQAWNWQWELKYSDWVRMNLTPDFFEKYKLATTCSDVEFYLRWIFSRDNGLPAANRLASGELFTTYSSFPGDDLPSANDWFVDKRFLAALRYLTHHTDPRTLWRDSYPIAINNESLIPGAYHINKGIDNAHTMIIWQVNHIRGQVPVITLSSTTPRDYRVLNQYMYVESKADPVHLGIFRMRWAHVENGIISIVPGRDMPYYSTEQFMADFVKAPRKTFWEEIFARVNPNVDFGSISTGFLSQIAQMYENRQELVEKGYAACLAAGGCNKDTQAWEDWSTPGLDAKITADINVYVQLRDKVPSRHIFDPQLKQTIVNKDGLQITLDQLITAWPKAQFSSNPNASIKERWGEATEITTTAAAKLKP